MCTAHARLIQIDLEEKTCFYIEEGRAIWTMLATAAKPSQEQNTFCLDCFTMSYRYTVSCWANGCHVPYIRANDANTNHAQNASQQPIQLQTLSFFNASSLALPCTHASNFTQINYTNQLSNVMATRLEHLMYIIGCIWKKQMGIRNSQNFGWKPGSIPSACGLW